MKQDIEDLCLPVAAALVRPQPNRHKGQPNAHKKLLIKHLLKQSKGIKTSEENIAGGGIPLAKTGMVLVELLTRRETSSAAGAGMEHLAEMAKMERGLQFYVNGRKIDAFRAYGGEVACVCKSDSTQPSFSKLETFASYRSHYHITRGSMLRKGGTQRIAGDELEAQRQILQEMKSNRWTRHLPPPFAVPCTVLATEEDVLEKTQYRMVVNYQELDFMTI
ncbi:hypothetical protein Esti_003607 [Eimeria stiedai]